MVKEHLILKETGVLSVKVSIIIPCYNIDEKLLKRCIQSMQNQTYADFEMIIVNDGSDKDYDGIFDLLSDLDARIRVLKSKHLGVSAARNLGVAEARGEYIVFVDADDVIMPCFLSESIEIAKCESADVVIGANRYIYSEEINITDIEHADSINYTVYEGEQKEEIKLFSALSKNYQVGKSGYIGRGPVSRLVKKDVAQRTPFDEKLVFAEDRVWNLQLLKNSEKVVVANQIWYVYCRNRDSVTNKYNPHIIDCLEDYLHVMRSYLDFDNDAEYYYYVVTLLHDLEFICVCYLGSKRSFKNKEERKKTVRKIYTTMPWVMIREKRFFKLASLKYKIKTLAYKSHLLILFFIKHKIKG